MWKVCSMQMLSRRATSGTHLKSRVPEWHVYRAKRAKNHQNWHTFTKKTEKHACQICARNIFVGAFFEKLHAFCNHMINHQFQCCNHRCEVCGNKNQININRDRHNNKENGIYTDGIIDIFTAGQIIFA